MSDAVLSTTGISKAFDGTTVLQGMQFAIARGEVVALLGENGAGKSTFLNIVSGALAADAGEIVFDGLTREWRGPKEAIDAGIAFVHQELSVIRGMSVKENIFLGGYASDGMWIDRRAMRSRSASLLAQIGAEHIEPGAIMGSLSLADQQMVEIAKAISHELKLLIMDEPTSSLTSHEAAKLFAVVRRLQARGVAVIFISHRLQESFAIADRIVVLRDGRLVSDRPAAQVSREQVIGDMAGREFAMALKGYRPSPGAAQDVLALRGIGDGRRVGPVSLGLKAGEILGVFGLVGSGRTELLELLCGLRPAATGSATLLGREGLPKHMRDAMDRGIALVPEGRKTSGVLPNLRVAENLLTSVRQRRPAWLSPKREQREGATLIEQYGVKVSGPAQLMRMLSGGNQQKALIARCLATQPKLLLLDEPTHGVDVRTKAYLYDVIHALAAKGLAVIFVSSELPELLALASKVLVLSKGQVTFLGDNHGLEESAILAAAFAGHEADREVNAGAARVGHETDRDAAREAARNEEDAVDHAAGLATGAQSATRH